MVNPVITDRDVVTLVRKEFERKLKDFCEKQGIELEEPQEEDGGEEEEPDPESREPTKKKKPENLTLDIIQTLGSGIRLAHKDSGLDYYVAVNDVENQIMDISSPENYLFKVSYQELMDEYKLG
jgi:hypothetical protein